MADTLHPSSPHDGDFERLLFESARRDAVPEASRRRVGLALGIGTVLPLDSAPQPSPGGASTMNVGQPSALAVAEQGQLALLGKSALFGLVGGSLALAVALRFGEAPTVSEAAAPVPVPSQAAPRVTPPEALRPAPPGNTQAPTPVAALPAAPAAPAAPPARHASGTDPSRRRPVGPAMQNAAVHDAAPAESRLIAEVRQLDGARSALAAGKPNQALAELARYHSEFPGGTLELDARLLEVRALERAGQRAAAHRLARGLLSRPGTDRYRAELQAFINPLASGSRPLRRDIEEAR